MKTKQYTYQFLNILQKKQNIVKAETTSLRTSGISYSSRFISSGFSTIHILSTFSSHNVRELGIVFLC